MSLGTTLKNIDSRFSRRDKIIISFTIIGITLTYLVINRAIKVRLINKINQAIDNGVGLSGSTDDIVNSNAFDPAFYKTTPSKYTSRLLKPTQVTKYANRIKASADGDGDEDFISIINEFDSKAQVSQVSAVMKTKYGKNLRDMMQDTVNAKNSIISATSLTIFGYTIGGGGSANTDMETFLAKVDAIVKSLPNY